MKKYSFLFKKLSNHVKPLLVVALFLSASNTNNVFAQDWDQLIKLVASDRAEVDEFGYSVAISGNYAIVGAPDESHDATGGNSLNEAGSAYIFKNIAGTWLQVQKIVASDRETFDFFGCSVAILGDYAIVGAYGEDHNAQGGNFLYHAGSAYIFKNNAGIWTEVQKIVASDRGSFDEFGYSVAISGDYAIVGAYGEGHDATGEIYLHKAGSAYIFKNNAGTWSQVQKIVASDRGSSDEFGYSVAISGEYAIVGAIYQDMDTTGENWIEDAGSAYIFKNNSGTWSQVQKIVASDRGEYDNFGYSVAISGDYSIVGAIYEEHDTAEGYSLYDAGSAYFFKNIAGTWLQLQKVIASDREIYDHFGVSVAITEDYAIVGAYNEDHDTSGGNNNCNAGSAYIFKDNAGTWTEVQKIVASDRGELDYFGNSVSISGNYAIVGAYFEDHDETGGNYLYEAGSAYIFKSNSSTFGIEVNSFGNGLKVYPNPSNGNFFIDLGAIFENVQIKITDISGKLIDLKIIVQSQVLNLSIDEPAGIYVVTIQADNKKAVLRLVKE